MLAFDGYNVRRRALIAAVLGTVGVRLASSEETR